MPVNRQLFVSGLALAMVAACSTSGTPPQAGAWSVGSVPQASASPAAPAQGELTQPEAALVLDRYREQVQQARLQDGAGLEAASTGLALELDRADLRLAKLRGDRPGALPQLTSTRFIIPKNPTGARWFLAEITEQGEDDRTQLILQETSAGWRLVARSNTPLQAAALPIAVDDEGRATAVAADATTKLAVAPRVMAAAHARSLATNGKDARANRLLGAGRYTTQSATARLADLRLLRGQWDVRDRTQVVPSIYALRASGGGAVVWYGVREQQTFAARPKAATLSFTRPEPAALSGKKEFRNRVILVQASWFAAVVPASRSKKTRIVADWTAQISVTGD
ncbi:hypothetical protein [Nonomuraea sp. NPDC049141]|uniref:hypothetical protein n=1 Tax=Nonomuraea sp. NPDC049141 TaxID=3155500 RepID=UPI003400D3CF